MMTSIETNPHSINFFAKNTLLYFIFLPALFVSGNIAWFLAVPVLFFFALLTYTQKNYALLILFYFTVAILGNNIKPTFAFAYNLRAGFLLFFNLLVLWEVSKGFYKINKVVYFIAPFILSALFSMSMAEGNVPVGVMRIFSYFFLIIFVFNFIYNRLLVDGESLVKAISYFIYISLFINFITIILLPSFSYSRSEGRANGIFGNPNELGIYLFFSVVWFTLVFNYGFSLFSKKFKISVYIFIAFAIIATGSRASLSMSSAFLLIFYGLSGSKIRLVLFVFVLLPILAYFFLFVDITQLIVSLGLGQYLRAETIESGSGREIVWAVSWIEIDKAPLFGRGFGYNDLMVKKYEEYLLLNGHEGGTHNYHFTFLLNVGYIGYILYHSFIGFLFLKTLRTKFWQAAIALIPSVIIYGLFEEYLASSLTTFTFMYFLIIAVMLAFAQHSFYQNQNQ